MGMMRPLGFRLSEATKQKMSLSAKKAGVGKWQRGRKSNNWKGGLITIEGYFFILNKEHPYSNARGYIAVHRLVVEKEIGRYLKKQEVVHHINKNKKDNKPTNLMAFSSHSAHMRYEQGGIVKEDEIVLQAPGH